MNGSWVLTNRMSSPIFLSDLFGILHAKSDSCFTKNLNGGH